MKRVAVIGSGGSGKSTFARELASRTGLPLVHLDRLFWQPGWVPTPDEQWRELQVALVRDDEWILDGNYSRTLDARLAAADTVFFFDTPTLLSVAGVLRRWARHHGRALQADGCPELVSLSFLLWVWRYRRRTRPRVLEQLRSHAGGARVVVVRSRRDATAALRALPSSTAVRSLSGKEMN
jgi:adenylate kinase family enzyme